jgi:PAS domain-containing protein
VADDIVKADAQLRLVLPLSTLRAGQVVELADLDQVAAGFPVLRDLVARMGVASLALVPLESRGRFLGLLALCWTEHHQLNREQEALLGLAGNQIAGALEAALRLEEAERAAGEAQAVFYAIADGVLLTDPYGRVTAMNRALEALTGWTEAEARGRPYAEVLPWPPTRWVARPTWSAATAARSRWPSPRRRSSTPGAGSSAGST